MRDQAPIRNEAPKVIKGNPCDRWDDAQAIQNEPFIYVMSCGSKWAGDEPNDVSVLLDMLAKHPLDPRFEYREPHFYTVDPCEGVVNPQYGEVEGAEHWIDGPRLYSCDGVVRFFGNFLTYSHGFLIDTNHAPTVEALIAAINANVTTDAYKAARGSAKPQFMKRTKVARKEPQRDLFAEAA